MKKNRSSFVLLAALVFVVSACSDSKQKPLPFSAEHFMTAQDILNASYSNLSITNAAGATIEASGLFVASFDVNDCSACFGNIVSGNNATGAFVEPVSFKSGQSIKIGQNYLYNLIYNGIYGIKTSVGSSPCQLPGCSWPGDDSNVIGWCLSIGVMSRNSAYTSSAYVNGENLPANVVPFGDAVASEGNNYNYNLNDPLSFGSGAACLGPIVCDDQTLTCTVSTPQSQSFQPYIS